MDPALHSFLHDDPTRPADYFAQLVSRVVEQHQVEWVAPLDIEPEDAAPSAALDC